MLYGLNHITADFRVTITVFLHSDAHSDALISHVSHHVSFSKKNVNFLERGLDVSRIVAKTIEECTSIMYIAVSAVRYC